MTKADALRRSLVSPERLAQGGAALVTEARAISSTGHVLENGARVQTPVERYLKRGQLTQRQADAAERLYRAWATGVAGARMEAPGCVSYSPSGWADAQVQARRVYEAARDHVGGRLWPLVFHVCVMDWTADRFANEAGRNSTSTMEVLRYALDSLGDSLGLPD